MQAACSCLYRFFSSRNLSNTELCRQAYLFTMSVFLIFLYELSNYFFVYFFQQLRKDPLSLAKNEPSKILEVESLADNASAQLLFLVPAKSGAGEIIEQRESGTHWWYKLRNLKYAVCKIG